MDSAPHVPARRLRALVLGLLAAIFLLVLLEGTSSILFVLTRHPKAALVQERLHTEYDPDLGWINLPQLRIEDMYGRGVSFTTNRQRFRSVHDVDVAIPAGKRRVVCSGDSFTLGYGVGDDETWCHRLGDYDTTLESVNMGQNGYGIDQAYLWYERDGKKLGQDLHVFAFIDEDLDRMASDTFAGYGKPTLRIPNGTVLVSNTPVPRASYRVPVPARALPLLAQTRIAQLFGQLASRAEPSAPAPRLSKPECVDLAVGLFEDLARTHAAAGVRFLVVRLPAFADYRRDDLEPRKSLSQRLPEAGIPYLDLGGEADRLEPPEHAALFLEESRDLYRHPSPSGHERIARAIRCTPQASGVVTLGVDAATTRGCR